MLLFIKMGDFLAFLLYFLHLRIFILERTLIFLILFFLGISISIPEFKYSSFFISFLFLFSAHSFYFKILCFSINNIFLCLYFIFFQLFFLDIFINLIMKFKISALRIKKNSKESEQTQASETKII